MLIWDRQQLSMINSACDEISILGHVGGIAIAAPKRRARAKPSEPNRRPKREIMQRHTRMLMNLEPGDSIFCLAKRNGRQWQQRSTVDTSIPTR